MGETPKALNKDVSHGNDGHDRRVGQIARGAGVSSFGQGIDRVSGFAIQYIENWSLWLDIAIILKTVRAVLRHEGAY